jgi:hypothetical protein
LREGQTSKSGGALAPREEFKKRRLRLLGITPPTRPSKFGTGERFVAEEDVNVWRAICLMPERNDDHFKRRFYALTPEVEPREFT